MTTIIMARSYLAPSRNGYGWGVYASQAFQKGDIVDIAPMFLRIDLEEHRAPVLKETILNNYHYEYFGWDGIRGKVCQYSMISFGMTLYYNHQSPPPKKTSSSKNRREDDSITECVGGPNIEQRKVGMEPDMDFPDRSVAIVYFALRDIEAGEELLVDYGGSDWFKGRGMREIVTTTTTSPNDNPDQNLADQIKESQSKQHKLMQELSGKVYGGYHQQVFRSVMDCLDEEARACNPFRLETIVDQLPSDKSCFGSVSASKHIEKGETIEYVPALLLRKDLTESTLLEPLAFSWQDMDETSPAFATGRPIQVNVQYQPDLDKAVTSTKVQIPTEQSVLFALAGTISLMARASRQDGAFNAVLHVETDPYNEDGFCVRAIACHAIVPGDRIVLGVSGWNPSLTETIVEELCLTGQPFSQ